MVVFSVAAAAAAVVDLFVRVARVEARLAWPVSQGVGPAMQRVLLGEGSMSRWKVLWRLVVVL